MSELKATKKPWSIEKYPLSQHPASDAVRSNSRPEIVGDPIAKIENYNDCHETAVELGYPSITEALEHLGELRGAGWSTEAERLLREGRDLLKRAYEAAYLTAERMEEGSHLQVEANQLADEIHITGEYIDTYLGNQND